MSSYLGNMTEIEARRFLSPDAVAEILSISVDDVHELIGRGELLALHIGSRGPWRVEVAQLEMFIADQYEHARRMAVWEQADFANIPELSDGRIL